MELLEIELKVKAKLKVAKMILPILRPSAAWCSTVTRGGLERYFSVTGQGRKARPGQGSLALASPTLGPVHQSSQQKTFPHSKCKMVHHQEPQAAEGHRVGGMISETLSFIFTSNSISKSFMMKCLRYFLLEILKKTVSP